MSERPIMVAIWTDGMGTHQARCMDCPWKGEWRRDQDKAVEIGRTHTEHLPFSVMPCDSTRPHEAHFWTKTGTWSRCEGTQNDNAGSGNTCPSCGHTYTTSDGSDHRPEVCPGAKS